MGEITGNRPVGGMQVGSGNDNVQNQDGGPVAKGIGLFKKIWLHITGKVESAHSKQLTNLRAQVSQDFGANGLKNLESILQKKGWNSDTSTKLFSSSELQNIMGKVQTEEQIDKATKNLLQAVYQNPSIIFEDTGLRDILVRFSEKYQTQENVNFLCAMYEIPAGTRGRDVDTGKLQDIVREYIGDEAPQCVYQDAHPFAASVLNANNALTEALQSGDQTAINRAKNNLLIALQDIRNDILNVTMENMSGEPGRVFEGWVRDIAEQQLRNEVLMARLELSGLTPPR